MKIFSQHGGAMKTFQTQWRGRGNTNFEADHGEGATVEQTMTVRLVRLAPCESGAPWCLTGPCTA